MTEVIFRVDPEGLKQPDPPADATAARDLLLDGNRRFVNFFDHPQVVHVSPESVGFSPEGVAIPHTPFAAVLGCSDARVPIEFLFRCPSNNVFVVRVAGNVAGGVCVGSLEYAVNNLAESLRLILVLGHSGCGAVTAAVDSYLDHQSYHSTSVTLRSVVDRILPAVRLADDALAAEYGGRTAESPGGREALIAASVTLNAAMAAAAIHSALSFPVEYGFFDMLTRQVTVAEPPGDGDAMIALAAELATCDRIRLILDS